VSSAAEREDLLKKVRDETGFTYQSLSRDLEEFAAAKPTERKQNIERQNAEKSDKVKKACRFILGAVLFHQPYAENYPLQEDDFSDDVHRTIVRYILDCREKGQKIRATDLFEVFGENTAEFNEILDLNIDERLLGEGSEKYFTDSVKTVGKDNLQRKIDAVKQAVQEEKEIARRRALTEELNTLTKDLKKYQ
jgi:replicative DNA helicase